jgi:3-oxoacyl-[acyl-carrier protein] reductase
MKTHIVVGGTKGIGRATLESLPAEDQRISISRNMPERPIHGVQYLQADITTDELPEVGEVDSVTYCPGSINLRPFKALKREQFLADLEINYLGAVKTIQAYLKSLKGVDNASIVLFSTVAVGQGMPFHSSIAGAKGAVEGLVRSLSAELAPDIRVNAIAPTVTDTNLASRLLRDEKARENIASRQPLKRIVDPSEIGAMVAFLHSNNARSITGQILGIDAGMSVVRN